MCLVRAITRGHELRRAFSGRCWRGAVAIDAFATRSRVIFRTSVLRAVCMLVLEWLTVISTAASSRSWRALSLDTHAGELPHRGDCCDRSVAGRSGDMHGKRFPEIKMTVSYTAKIPLFRRARNRWTLRGPE